MIASPPSGRFPARRLPWLVLALLLAVLALALPSSHVLHPPLAPMETTPLAKVAVGLAALLAAVRGVVGVGLRFDVDPIDRLPRPARLGRGSVGSPVVWLVGITLVGSVLRLHSLDGELWIDELLTVLRHLDRPVHELVLWPADRNLHLLYALSAKATTAVWGLEEWAIRLPAALFGIATVPAVYALGRTFLRTREALLAATLLAVSYHHVFFSQNARGYSGLLLFTALSTTFLIRALRDDRAHDWMAYVGCAFLGAATSLLGALVPAGQALALPFVALRVRAAGGRTWPLPTKAAGAIGVTALATVGLHGTGLSSMLRVATRARERAVETAQPRPFWSELWTGLVDGFGEAGILALAVVTIALLPGSLRVVRRYPVIVAVLLGPLVATAIAFAVTGFHVFPRYFLWTLPVFSLLVVAVAAALAPSTRWLPVATVVILAAGSIFQLPRIYRVPKQPTRTSLAWVLETSDPADLLLSTPTTMPGVRFYLPRLEGGEERHVEPVGSVSRLEWIERTRPERRTWVIDTELDHLEDRDSLRVRLARRYRRAKTFPATIEGMDVVVWVGPVEFP